MKITNDAQAQAARKTMDALRNMRGVFSGGWGFVYMADELKAALAAWEARQIELTEDELVMLRYCELDHDDNEPRWVNARHLLQKRGLIDDKLDATPAGRAYLEAQKREKKWGVWCNDGGDCGFIAEFHSEFEATTYKAWRELQVGSTVSLEVRKVK